MQFHNSSKMGYIASTRKGMYFGHKSYAGLELIGPYVFQVSQNIINLVRILHVKVLVTKAANLWWIFQDGKSQCPLQNPDIVDSVTDSIWFTELKTFLQSNRLQLSLNIALPPLQRENDKYIMDVAFNQGYTKR
jgi:hypothetical protein